MRFYTKQHKHCCGIDLHARTMYLCILDQAGEVLLHKNYRANPEMFLKAVAKYREDLVVAVARLFLKMLFGWYKSGQAFNRNRVFACETRYAMAA